MNALDQQFHIQQEDRPAREIQVKGDIAIIPLTQGYVAVIDAQDVPLVEGFRWHAKVQRRSVYAARRRRAGSEGSETVRMHRVIADAADGMDVDHLNHDGLDNRRSNLRVCTRSENMHNQRLSKANTTGYKGVRWSRADNKYVACIKLRGKRIYLGAFDNAEDAHEAYCKASKRLHGEFGCTGDAA